MQQTYFVMTAVGAVILGAVIGIGFGIVQRMAYLKHSALQEKGRFSSGWAAMPGSFRRVAFLLIALVAVQLACPIFFEEGSMPWFVSAGVVAGYGLTLYQNLRQRMTSKAHT